MLTEDERAAVKASTSDEFNQNLLLVMAPLFRCERIKWQLLSRRVIFRTCTLRQPAHTWKVGEVIDRVVLVFEDKGWHARLYKTSSKTETPVHLWLHATFGAVCANDASLAPS